MANSTIANTVRKNKLNTACHDDNTAARAEKSKAGKINLKGLGIGNGYVSPLDTSDAYPGGP